MRSARIASALVAGSIALTIVAAPVAADDGLEVTTPFPAVAVAPGDDVSFDLTVDSVRNATVDLEVSGVPEGWSASLIGGGNVIDAVSVTPSQEGEVRLDISVPADAVTGTDAIVEEFSVRAVGGGATDVLRLRVRVDAEAAGDISLTTQTPVLTGSSDATFSFTLDFSNDTAQDVTVAVAATGEPGWEITTALSGETQAASTVVEAGGTQSVTVDATAPDGTPAGQYPITVTAQAGDRAATADLGVEITGSYSLDLATPNDLLSASGSAGGITTQDFIVTNTGTAPLTEVALTATPPSGWTVTFDPETVPTLAPTESTTITASITPSSEAVAGDYVVTVSAAATESEADGSAQIRFTVETSPLWALIGLGIIVLILAGLFYVFRTYGRR